MTDEELTAFLRDLPFLRAAEAADRIEALTAKLATCEKYRDAYAECDSIGTQAVRDLEAKLAECLERNALLEARLGKADVHPEVSTYWSDYEEYCAMAEIEGEKT